MAVWLSDRFAGAMLGLALGDALGAPHEGGALGGLVWKLVGHGGPGELRWTDDTQMAVGLAESLVACRGFDADHVAARWADQLDWRRGYGPGTRKILTLVRQGEDWRAANRLVFPDGSLGNGAAMRSAPLGLFFHDDSAALEASAEQASRITHAHPLGIEGGVLMARAAALALRDEFSADEFLTRLHSSCGQEEFCLRLLQAGEMLGREPTRVEVLERLGNSVKAHESVVTALYAFARFAEGEFGELIEAILRWGGDTDTIGAMAGALYGAHRGLEALPGDALARLEDRDRIERLARRLCEAAEL